MSIKYVDGQIDLIRAQASSVQVAHGRSIAAINSDPTLSPEGKRVQLAENGERVKAQLQDLKAKEMQLVDDEILRLERMLDAKAGSTSSDIIAFRDAQDRAERISDSDEATRILSRADRTGDMALAHAVFRRAIDSGWKSTVQAFAQANPDLAEAANDLTTWKRFREPDMNRALAYSSAWS